MRLNKWYQSWFNSPLYEKLYEHRSDSEAARLVTWIAGRFPGKTFPRVLDMGCGRGRHSILLAKEGYEVTGVDLSVKAITKAHENAEKAQIPEVNWQIGDMRTWRNGLFDLVCSLFTSFGYFEDEVENIRVIKNMAANIRPGGYLILDYLNAGHIRKNLVPEGTLAVENQICRITRAIEEDTVVKSMVFYPSESFEERAPVNGKNPVPENDSVDIPGFGSNEILESDTVFRYQERVKLYDKEWFFRVFKKFGLGDFVCYGDYDGGRYDPDESSRLLIVARNLVKDQGAVRQDCAEPPEPRMDCW